MPLSEKARIEIYLPDLPAKHAYEELLNSLQRELAIGFGGCTIIRGLEGTYRSSIGELIPDRVNLLYTDIPYSIEAHFNIVSQYTAALCEAVMSALDEEAILIVIHKIYHASE